MKSLRTLFLFFASCIPLLMPVGLSAQTPSHLSISSSPVIRLPQSLSNLSIVDNRLYGYSDLLVCAPLSEKPFFSLQPDTLLGSSFSDADYIIRNPRDSMLYFTRLDDNGITNLYVYTNQRFCRSRQIDIHGWHRDICHPTFSPNGKMMVFASKGKVGLGGYDLWCSLWNGHRWTRPINLGNTVNTPGNEINPVFYHNYLIFASDSIPYGTPGYHLFALHMREASSIDEIIFDTYTIQPLPSPINSDGNDMNIAFHLPSDQGWWVSNRSGVKELYSFHGELDGVSVSGTVTDTYRRPLPNATVKLSLNGRTAASTHTNAEGKYQLFVLPNDDYLLQSSADGFFNYEQELPVVRTTERLLINSLSHNIQLSSLPLDHPILLQDVFSQSADIELSPQGINNLKPIANFLRDNPQIKATLAVYCDQTDDNAFNNMLIEQRINTLQQYLRSLLPSDTQFSIQNGNITDEIKSSDTGANFIFVTFSR